jgi:hypothetical protein
MLNPLKQRHATIKHAYHAKLSTKRAFDPQIRLYDSLLLHTRAIDDYGLQKSHPIGWLYDYMP